MEKTARFRLIATDLDGTLVNSGSFTVSPAVSNAVDRLIKKGIRFTIATGRSWKDTKPIADALRVNTSVIVESGALVINPCTGSVLSMLTLTPEMVVKLNQISLPAGVDCFRLSVQGTYCYEKVQSHSGHWFLGQRECRNTAQVEPDQAWLKYLLIGKAKLLESLDQFLDSQFGKAVNTILWPPEENGESYLEVFDGSASKGQALVRLAQDLNIPMTEVLAFGDSYNDFDLLAVAGLGVAIHGAPRTLLELADLVIPGPAEEGMVRFLSGDCDLWQKKAI